MASMHCCPPYRCQAVCLWPAWRSVKSGQRMRPGLPPKYWRCRTQIWLIAYATEAVFGLGCDPWNSAAIARIMQLKRRKLSKGLILIAADKAQLEPFIRFPNRAVLERVCSTWPGPVTWVLPACAGIPRGLRGDHQSLAVRVTAPLARALC